MAYRVFAEGPLTAPDELTLSPEESHYLVRVRRAHAGDEVEVLDGRGAAFDGVVVTTDTKACGIRLLRVRPPLRVPPIDLGIAIIDPKAALDALARACEGGATAVTWLETERSMRTTPSPARIARVLRASMRQCGRDQAPSLSGPTPLSEWLERATSPGWIASAAQRLHDGAMADLIDLRAVGPVRLLIGPEGGWTTQEVALATASGFRPLPLGPWILRTEVAVTAALSRLLGPSPTLDHAT